MNKKLAVREGESSGDTLQRQAVQELQWFEDQGFHRQVEDGLATTKALLDRVNRSYVQYVRSHWLPQTVGHLVQALSQCEEEEVVLGVPEADGAVPAGAFLDALRAAAVDCVLPQLQGVYHSEAQAFFTETLHRLRQPLMDAIRVDDSAGNNVCYSSEPVTLPVAGLDRFLSALRWPNSNTVLQVCQDCVIGLPRRWARALDAALGDDKAPFRLQRFPGLVAQLRQHFVNDPPAISANAFEDVRTYLAGPAFAPGSAFIELIHDMRAQDSPVVRVTFNPRAVVEAIVYFLVRGQAGMYVPWFLAAGSLYYFHGETVAFFFFGMRLEACGARMSACARVAACCRMGAFAAQFINAFGSILMWYK